MGRASLISLVIHTLVLIFLSVSFQSPFKKIEPVETPLLIEFAEISEVTAAPKLAPIPEIKSESKPEKIEEKKPEDTPPPPETENLVQPEDQPKEEPKEEPKPEPKKQEPKPAKEEAAPNLDKKPEPKKPEPKKEKPKEVKKPAPEKKKKDEQKKDKKKTLEKAQVNLKKNQPNAKKNAKTDPKKKSASLDNLLKNLSDSPDNNDSAMASHESDVVTASQIDAIRSRIRKCWFIPAGLKNARDITVDVRMELAEDGTVKKAEIVDKSRMNSDPEYRTMAESARRAVLDPECNPLPMPKGKYNMWKDLEMSFTPRDMF